MIYLAFFKSLITTIKPIFFRFFSIIKYLILVLLAILLYMLVGRVGAINLNTLTEVIRFQHEHTGHVFGLEHIPYHNNNLSVSDVQLGVTPLPVGNLLRSNYYSNKGYKVVLGRSYSSNFISGLMVTKKGTFNHTIGYPYGVDKLQTFNIPADGFLGGLSNLFSSKKFKNVVAHNFGLTFYNENSNENYLEVTSHMCGKEYPGYIITYVSFPTSTNTGSVDSGLRVYDLKNNLLYVYKDVGNQHNGPNSGGCGVVNYFSENADVVWKIRIIYGYQKGAIFLYNPIVNYRFQYGSHSENFHNYRGFHLVEKIAEKKAPEQYQAQVETYNNSKLKITCEKTAKDINKQISLLHQCKERTKPDNVYGWGLIDEFAIHISGRVENYRDPTKLSTANVFMNTRCKQWHDGQVAIYNTYIKNLDGSDPLYSKYINIYQDIFDKVYEPIASGGSTAFDQDSYCENNPIFIDGTKPSPTIIQTVKDGWDNLYNSYFGSSSDDAITTGNIQENTPTLLKPFKSLFDNYFNFKKFTVIETVNYCKEQGGRTFANLLYFFILILISLFLIKLFK